MKQLFFVGLMTIAFAGCSGDNAYDNGGGNPIEGDQFMAVKLVMSGDAASTRAFGDAGFEAGTEDEVGVTKATFLFFDGETQVADPYETTDLNPWTEGTTSSVDKVSAPVIVLSNAIKNPTSIVAILNPSEDITVTRSTTLTELKNINSDYSKYTTASKFVMSNSVYNAGGKNVIGAPCTDANIKKTQDEAKANPVKIAVEKVVAKVNVKQGDGMAIKTNTVDDNDNVVVDGKTKKVTAEITGWWLDNTNSTSYLIKKLETSYTSIGSDTWWNDETNRRSYWATPADGTLNHHAYNTAKPLTENRYCLENTKQETPTQIVVAATLKVDNKAEDLVKFLSVVYTVSGFQKELTKQLSNKYYTKTDSSYTPLTEDKLTFTYNVAAAGTKPYEVEVTVALQSGVSVFTSTNPSDSGSYTQADTATLTTDLANLKCKVQYWKDGKTYYYLPIVHNGDITVTPTTPPAAATHGLYGVIRNHLYKLTIKSINGLGTPVPNPDTPIIPEKPEDDNSYIAAQIEILKYKVVTQDVDLGL